MYNFAAAINQTTISDKGVGPLSVGELATTISRVQGICPEGWVLPDDYDWNNLEYEIASNPSKYSSIASATTWDENYRTTNGYRPNSTTNGHSMSMKSTTKVNGSSVNPNGTSNSASNGGFDGLLVGYVYSAYANKYGSEAIYWTGNAWPVGDINAWIRVLYATNAGVYRNGSYSTGQTRSYMFSVRCKRYEN